jgi:type VI protein secretion system component Hcp
VRIRYRRHQVTRGQVETLFSGLNDKEQAILSHILLTAAESTSEVSGFADGFAGFAPTLAVGVRFNDIAFTHTVDKSSAKLYLACANGEHFKRSKLQIGAGGDGEKTCR